MNLDHPNKNERQMKETVQQYKAPFDPKAWEDMKSKLAQSSKHPNAGGQGHAKSDSFLGTFFNFKNLLLMTLTIVFFTTLLWNVFNINPNIDTLELNDSSAISINGNTKNNKETYLDTDQYITGNIENNSLSTNTLDSNITSIKDKDKTRKATLNQNNTSNDSKEKSNVDKSDITPDKFNTLPVHQAIGIGVSNLSNNIVNQVTKNVATQNFGATNTTISINNSVTNLASNSSSNTIDTEAKATGSHTREFETGLGKIGLLPIRFGSLLPIEVKDLDLPLNQNDPTEKVKMNRFSLGLFGGTSYSTFSKPNSFNIVGGAMAKFKITNQFSLQSDISWRNLNANNTQHIEERFREDSNGILIEERKLEVTLQNVQVFESSVLLSYQLRKLNFPISRLFAGVRPVLLNAPESSSIESVAIGMSPEPTLPWNPNTDYRAGFSKFDLGLVFGFEVPISKRIYLDTRVNMNFKDITDEAYWNVDPKKNTFSDIQLTLRWDILNF